MIQDIYSSQLKYLSNSTKSYPSQPSNEQSFWLRGGSTLQWENRAYFLEMNCKGSTKDINTIFF